MREQTWTRSTRLQLQKLAIRSTLLVVSAMFSALVLSACDLVGEDAEDQAQQQQSQQQEAQEAQQQAEPAAPTATTSSTPPATSEPATPAPPRASGGGDGAIAYNILYPSLALVMSADQVATGLVISDGYVLVDGGTLSNAGMVEVALSNGDTLSDVPQAGIDTLTGLSYYGPLEMNLVRRLPGTRLGDGENLRPGSAVFAVGYIAGEMAGAQPSVYSGILSGTYDWEAGGRTLLRTDARADTRTAGMVLIDSSGTVIGIGSHSLAGNGRYVSTGDLARAMPPGDAPDDAAMDSESAALEHSFALAAGEAAAEVFLGDEATGESLLLLVSTTESAVFQMIDAEDAVQSEIALNPGSTIMTIEPSTMGPYRLAIMRDSAESDGAEVTFSADVPLIAMVAPDEQMMLERNTSTVGSISLSGNQDTFLVELRAGSVYELVVESLLIDALVAVEGAGIEAVDDDSAGGPAGSDAMLTLAPESDGVARVTVSDYFNEQTGAYVVTFTQISGEEPDGPTEPASDDSMMSAAMLPAPSAPPVLSVRGMGSDEGLMATLAGIDSMTEGNGLVVVDADGSFEIVVSVIGADGASGRVHVIDAEGEAATVGTVLVSCASEQPCLARSIFVVNESEAGEWVVELTTDAPGITEWQLEIHRND